MALGLSECWPIGCRPYWLVPLWRASLTSLALGGAVRRTTRRRRTWHATIGRAGRSASRVSRWPSGRKRPRRPPRRRSWVPAQANEHPLMPALRWAYSGLGNVEKLQDYSATLAKRERIGGKVATTSTCSSSCGTSPSASTCTSSARPTSRAKRCIYIEGQNDGNMWAHGVGMQEHHVRHRLVEARRTDRHAEPTLPADGIGHPQLDQPAGGGGEQDMKYGECEVKFYKGAKINNRVCTCIEVVHPAPRRNFLFHLARIFVDDELNLPIRYESYDWPKEQGASAGVDRRVHLPEPEAQQRVYRRRFRHEESELQVPLMPGGACGVIARPRAARRREVVRFKRRGWPLAAAAREQQDRTVGQPSWAARVASRRFWRDRSRRADRVSRSRGGRHVSRRLADLLPVSLSGRRLEPGGPRF